MNQRVHNLTKWTFLPEGRSLRYENVKRRMVILDVNCPDEVRFYVIQDEDAAEDDPERLSDLAAGRRPSSVPVSENADVPPTSSDGRAVTFVGLVKGRDRLEFAVDGPFELMVEGGSAYVYTFDGQDVATRVVEPLVFTRLANRRARNPQLELMQLQMRINQERMLRQLEEESDRRIRALEDRVEQYAPERYPGTALGRALVTARRPTVDEAEGDDATGAPPDADEPEVKKPHRKRKSDEVEASGDGD